MNRCPTTSGAFVHQAYHLKQLFDRTDVDIAALDVIYEVGAGYGVMPLLIERLGFEGDYYILDLPEFCLIQRYYLSNVEAELEPIYANPARADLVIAMHSIGEMSIKEREPFELVDARYYLIGYKPVYGGFDNTAYFARFMADRPHIEWWNFQPWMHLQKAQWDLVGAER